MCYNNNVREGKSMNTYKDLVCELCDYFGFDDLFPYEDLDEIEKRFKDFLGEVNDMRIKLILANRSKKD